MERIKVTQLPLPQDSADIKFAELCIIEGGTVRVEMDIKGIRFKRLHQRGSRRLPVVWEDPTHHFDGPMILDNEKAADLEAIFKNYLLEQKLSIEDLLEQKRIAAPGVKYTEGQYVDYPRLIQDGNKLSCPVCGKEWQKTGRGFGFVKRGAQEHVSSCFEKELAAQGLQMEQPYCMENLGWKLIKK